MPPENVSTQTSAAPRLPHPITLEERRRFPFDLLVPGVLTVTLLGAMGYWAMRPSRVRVTRPVATHAAPMEPPVAPVNAMPESIAARHLLVMYRGSQRAAPGITRSQDEARARAHEALRRALAHENFGDLVRAYSDEPGARDRGGELGTFRRGMMVPEFERAAFALRPGEISPVVQTAFGYHVIQRTDGVRIEHGVADGDGNAVEARYPVPTSPDPRAGRFALAQATVGLCLHGVGNLTADIETSMGTLHCALFSDRAPNTVANFVGLARGVREFWDPVTGEWARRPFYDGSIFHRVIPGFVIQGGDVTRSGTGGTGYEFADENVRPHDAAGLLCMANRGPNTNGGQFFITDATTPSIDTSYSIFGRCTPLSLVHDIASVARDGRDRPERPVFIRHVTVRNELTGAGREP